MGRNKTVAKKEVKALKIFSGQTILNWFLEKEIET